MKKSEENYTNKPNAEVLLEDAAPVWYFERLAKYFGGACQQINSVYLAGENRVWGQIVLFDNSSQYFFEAIVDEGYITVVSLHLEGDV